MHISKAPIEVNDLTDFFVLSGSARAKAACRKLMKLTAGVYPTKLCFLIQTKEKLFQ